MEKYREIEKSIIKKYRKDIWSKFIQAIKQFKMINENDSIAVCISGGKDSFMLAKCMQELKRHGQIQFDLKFIVMDPGYNEFNLKKINENAKIMNIPIEIFKTDIFSVVDTAQTGSPCYLCARMRRGNLYSKAKELGCNKIALGHHFDDVIETVLMSMFYGGEFKTMMPKLHSTNFTNMELIRPLYFVREKDIISWVKSNNLEFINCACRFTENISNNMQESTRKNMKNLINDLKKINPAIDKNIYNSTKNVNLNTILGYKKNKDISFLDDYER